MSQAAENNPTGDSKPPEPLKADIPLEPLPEPISAVPVARPAAKPLLEMVDTTCPNCGATLRDTDVLCMGCGFDFKRGKVVKPETGVDVVSEPAPVPDFVVPGHGTPKQVAIVGLAIAVGAAIAAGVNAPRSTAGVIAAASFLTLYQSVLHTGTGLLGLWGASKIGQERFGRLDLAAARMFTSFAVFLLISKLRLPMEPTWAWVNATLMFFAGLGAYWLALFALFRKSRRETSVILMCHFAAWGFVEIGVLVAAWMSEVLNSAR